MQQTTEIHQLHSIDKELDVPVAQVELFTGARPSEIGQDPTVALVFLPGPGRSHARCVQRQMPGGSDALQLCMSRSCSTLTSDRCPCCCSSSTRCGRPCDFVATPSRSWKCIRTSSSPALMDIPVRNRDRMLSAVGWDDGYFRRILRHFSRSSGYPGVERQFFELSSAHNCECLRAGGARVAGSLLSGDSAPGLPIHPHVTWTYTHLKEATENNNKSHNNSHNNNNHNHNNNNHNHNMWTEHPHTRLFLDTFIFVYTSHCGSRCRTTCLHETCSSTCHHMSERLLFPCLVFFLSLSRLYFLSLFYLFSVLKLKPLHSRTLRSVAPGRCTTSHRLYEPNQLDNSDFSEIYAVIFQDESVDIKHGTVVLVRCGTRR